MEGDDKQAGGCGARDEESDRRLCRRLWVIVGTSRRVLSVLLTNEDLVTSSTERSEVVLWVSDSQYRPFVPMCVGLRDQSIPIVLENKMCTISYREET